MASQKYYLSRDPSSTSPPSSELLSIDAESPLAAMRKLISNGTLSDNWQSLWAHVLVWTSDDGNQRGFESIRLADVR